MLARVIGLLVPPLCVACGADAGRAAPLCRECRAAMRPLRGGDAPSGTLGASGAVGLSGAPSGAAAPSGAVRPAAAAAPWAAFAYDGPAGALVRALKFGGRVGIADTMAAQIAAVAPPGLLRGAVVPVPVHPAHARRRGVDHGLALARALARRARLPCADCLVRSGDPQPQVGRGRSARIRGPAGLIAVRQDADPPPVALLVDDVITTGATLAACVAALRGGGSQQITPIAYARTTAR